MSNTTIDLIIKLCMQLAIFEHRSDAESVSERKYRRMLRCDKFLLLVCIKNVYDEF